MIAAHEKRRGSATLIWVLAAFVISFVVWASNAPLDEIVRGPGSLVPSSKPKIVQSLEGGILDEINIVEGDTVDTVQVLARLNETQYLAEVRDFESQILTIDAQLTRLKAELELADELKLPEHFWKQDPELAASEQELFDARLFQFNSQLDAAKEQMGLAEEKVAIMKDMVDRNATPAIELLTARVAAGEARANFNEVKAAFQLDRSQEISRLVADAARLNAQVQQSRDQLARSSLKSPTDGIVNTIYTTTIGGVVRPGEPIFEIIPLNDELLVEARIQPKDIAFVTSGMSSTVKLSAYDYTIYGSLKGHVIQVSADTFEDKNAANAEPYYKVLIKLDQSSLAEKEGILEIRPGMLADAELHVGTKTVMQYIIKPIIRGSEALREP